MTFIYINDDIHIYIYILILKAFFECQSFLKKWGILMGQITIRLKDEDEKKLKIEAEKNNLSLAEFCRIVMKM